jgi:acetolactate synthase regulatory subunit
MDKVTIHVVAGPNQGKTTIASIIQDALRTWGFKDVTVLDMPASDDKPPIMERMVAATQRPIEIKVSQLQKIMCHNCKEQEVAYPGAKFCGAGCSQLWEMRPR